MFTQTPRGGRPKGGKGVFFMSEIKQFVDGLGDGAFKELCFAVEARKAKSRYGFDSLEGMASSFGRPPACPECGCADPSSDGFAENGSRRFRCTACGRRYGLLSESVLSSCKLSFWQWAKIVEIMPYNVPLDVVAEFAGCHHNTALLARRKVFEAVARWQSVVKLRGTVFIDEIYVFDSKRPKDHFGPNRRGLNKDKCCVFLAVDQYKGMVAFFVGHGYPTPKEIREALLPHLAEGSDVRIVHDGLSSHREAVRESGADEEVHVSTAKDPASLKAMLLINSFSAWVKRYLDRFTGMDTEYLQDYLNWFVYSFRCKQQNEKWPKETRILRHLLLERSVLKRASIPSRKKEKRELIENRRSKNGRKPVKTGGKRGRPKKNI